MALHPFFYGIVSTLLTYSSLSHTLHGSGQVSPANSSTEQVNYVTPNRSMPCLAGQHPCFTINEYASQVDEFFLNDSIFSFGPGNHSLNIGINISGIHNVSFIGLPDNSVAIIVLNWSACIVWKECKNIEIASIEFIVEGNFSCILSFKASTFVVLSNITILGNQYNGCSSIISENSKVDISNSKFVEINGYSGATLTALQSHISFVGRNYFFKNVALFGGSLYLCNSSVIFNGISNFTHNSAEKYCRTDGTPCNTISLVMRDIGSSGLIVGSGGAIVCVNSTLTSAGDILKLGNNINITSETCASDLVGSSDTNVSSFDRCFFESHNKTNNDNDLCIQFINKWKNNSNYCDSNIKHSAPCFSCTPSYENHSASLVFHHNHAINGGSIFGENGHIKISGSINFVANHASRYGGALLLRTAYVVIFGNIFLYKNSASISGGAMHFLNATVLFDFVAKCDGPLPFLSKIMFVNNSARNGGALSVRYTNMTLFGNIFLYKNSASISGGAMHFLNATVLFDFVAKCDGPLPFLSKIMFVNNSARNGGALSVRYTNMTLFGNIFLYKNSASISGGAMHFLNATVLFDFVAKCDGPLPFLSKIMFVNNSARNGGALSVQYTNMTLFGSIFFTNNCAYIYGGAIMTTKSKIFFGVNCSRYSIQMCTTSLFQCNFAQHGGGSIKSYNSSLWFRGCLLFYRNTADFGGAIIMDGVSYLILKSSLTITFIQNRAKTGGVVYYYDSVSSCKHLKQPNSTCFVSFDTSEKISPVLNFVDNSANDGILLYRGALGICSCYSKSGRYSMFDKCIISPDYCKDLYSTFTNVSIFSQKTKKSLLSGAAQRIKFCPLHYNNNYDNRQQNISVFPGKKFNITLIAVGPLNLTVNTTLSYKIYNPSDKKFNVNLIQVNQHATIVSMLCTNVSYYVLASKISEKVTVGYHIYHNNPCDSLVDKIKLYIDIKPCPLGFQLSIDQHICTCNKWLQNLGVTECSIDNLSLKRTKNSFWVAKQHNNGGLIFHNSRCPFDFCKDELVEVLLNNPSIQCDFKRKGTLCGQCEKKYSLALSTLHCHKCSNNYNVALVLPFALAGIALVMVILFLHLTVDVGTLNGLIFYANIVHSNREVYFQHIREISSNFHVMFISWLNLDFGIETCFYDGMDIYAYSWLQFVFPFYLWFLIGAIIFICRYSQRASRSLGRNPVAALGTVLLVSYGKVLNAIIVPLSKTELLLRSTDGSSSTLSVWLYDGSVEYFSEPKHIVLVLFAILILLLAFVPYTFILLCGHWLIAYSDKCFLSWLNKIKPFMDVYYAPFKQEARYWIGLTLLARLALLLTIAINAVGSDSVNLLVITSVTAGLLSIKGRVYEHNYNDLFESSFILNLCIFSIATFYLKEKDNKNQPAILNASIGVTFVTFIGIVFFHIYLVLKSTRIWKVCVISVFHKNKWLCKVFGIVQIEGENIVLNSNDQEVATSTIVELREPLIDNDKLNV